MHIKCVSTGQFDLDAQGQDQLLRPLDDQNTVQV